MSKQSMKGKANLPAGGFVALGRDNASDSSSSRLKSQSVSKKELQAPSGILKRARVNFGSALPSTSATPKRYVHSDVNWRKFCSEVKVEGKNLLSSLDSAFEKQKPHKAARIFCAVIREFIDSRGESGAAATDPLLYSALYLFIKRHHAFLMQAEVVDALCSLLTAGLPASAPAISFASSCLYSILQDSEQWNWVLIDCFIDDSLHERRWVDHPSSNILVVNLISAFGTQLPPEAAFSSCELRYPERFNHVTHVLNRFADNADKRSKLNLFVEHIREVCERKGESAPKNLLKTMCSCSGCPEIRLIASKKMDSWLQNGKLQRHAMELMLWIARNMGTNFVEEDADTLNCLLKLRSLKSKQINNLFNVALKEILNSDSDVMSIIMKLLLANEFTSNRFPFNMAIIHTLFSFDGVAASKVVLEFAAFLFYLIYALYKKVLAREICSVLAAKEEYLRVSRVFLREFARSLMRLRFDFVLFTEHLFIAVADTFDSVTIPDFLFKSVIDICAFLPFISMSPAVREGLQVKRGATTTPTQAHVDAVKNFYVDLLKFFEICSDFLAKHHDLCKDVGPQPQPARLFVYSYYRLFYFAPVDYYSSIDGWPTETETTQYIRAFSETPLSEKLFLSILEAAIDQSVPIEAPDAIDLVQNFTKRAYLASTINGNTAMVPISCTKTIDTLFRTTFYEPPFKFQIPLEELPSLAVKLLYWNAWLITVMWVSLNKGSLIKECYVDFPTLKIILQIVLTRDYRYPPGSMSLSEAEKLLASEETEMFLERETVKKLEARLAGHEVSENDSMLLGKLCAFAPRGVSRRPSDDFIRELARLNEELDLSRSLSECRDPDLLLDIIRSQGSVQALRPVLSLVESNENAITYLPLECICELFVCCLSSSFSLSVNKDKKLSAEKLSFMRNRLRGSLKGPMSNSESVIQILEYFISRLRATAALERTCAAHSLALLLQANMESMRALNRKFAIIFRKPDANASVLPVNPQASFTKYLYLINDFEKFKNKICCWIAQLCPVETDFMRLSEYIEFLIEYMDLSAVHLIACNLSSSIDRFESEYEEENICNLALSFYEKYISNAKEEAAEWTDDVQASLPAHAKKVVVTFQGKDGLEILNGSKDELLPATLKLKMVTSAEKRIADFALDQIVQVGDAVKYIKSYGLTEYGCIRLLKILDDYSGPLEGTLFQEASEAVPFINSYRKKGFDGGCRFLQRISKQQMPDKEVKMEIDDNDDLFVLDSFSFSNDLPSDSKQWQSALPEKIIGCVETFLTNKDPSFDEWIPVLSRIQKDVSIARAIVSLLQRKPALATNEKVLSCLLLVLQDVQLKDNKLHSDLCTLSTLINKKPLVPESIKILLRNMSQGTDKKFFDGKKAESVGIAERDPVNILSQLTKPTISDENRGVLLNDFLCRCPELIPTDEKDSKSSYSPALYQVIGVLFSKSLPVFDYIISLMPVRCSPKTISRIISCLLESHNTSLSSKSIMAAVTSSLHLARPSPLTRGHCAVLVEYILDELQRDHLTMSRMMLFLDKLAKHHQDLVCILFSTFSEILTSSVPGVRKRLVKQLVIKFRTMYPDVTMENDTIFVDSLSTIRDLDRLVRSLFIDLFTAASESNENAVDEKIIAIRQFASCRPHVLIRHLALMSGLLSSVVWLSVKELKNKYHKFLSLIPELLLSFSPHVFDEPQNVKAVLQHFFYFFEKVGHASAWSSLAVTIMQVCEHFLRIKAKEARPYLLMNQEIIEDIASSNIQHPSAQIVLDAIAVASDQI